MFSKPKMRYDKATKTSNEVVLCLQFPNISPVRRCFCSGFA